MATMLELTDGLPEVQVPAGYTVCAEGDPGGSIWVLVDGVLAVMKGAVQVNTIDRPGAIVGEMAVLLGSPATATVVAREPSRLRRAGDGAAFMRSNPEVPTFVAAVLAERLQFVTTYLADLKHHYGDAPGLAMVGDVLTQLAVRQGPTARPGSARDPDPEY